MNKIKELYIQNVDMIFQLQEKRNKSIELVERTGTSGNKITTVYVDGSNAFTLPAWMIE